eukprot:3124114-Pleurochrysis_carterae.AAC.1
MAVTPLNKSQNTPYPAGRALSYGIMQTILSLDVMRALLDRKCCLRPVDVDCSSYAAICDA